MPFTYGIGRVDQNSVSLLDIFFPSYNSGFSYTEYIKTYWHNHWQLWYTFTSLEEQVSPALRIRLPYSLQQQMGKEA